MNEKNRSATIFSNLIWRFLERCSAQLVAFIVSIILARLLDPTDYGIVALITVITAILQVFVDSGLGNALIQKKDADETDFSTVFYANIVFCLALYICLYIAAPHISVFYKEPNMTAMIRVLGITILISGLKNVQQAYVSRNMQFKRFFFSALAGTVTAAIVGIVMAYNDFGVWALILQQVINLAIDTAVLWLTVKWHPCRAFSLCRLKLLYSYGWKLLASALLETTYKNLRQLIIGKAYSASDLAFYNQGEKFPHMVISNINSSIDSVLLPALSGVQDEKKQVKNMTRRAIGTSVYIMAPIMMGLCFSAPVVVKLVLTDKWIPCVPYLRIFCISYMFYPIHTANLNALKAMGRSDLFLKLEIEKKIVQSIILLSAMRFGVLIMAWSVLAECAAAQFINARPNRRLMGYGYMEQLKDIIPSIMLALFMGICILPIIYLELPDVVKLGLQMIIGIVIYISGSIILKLTPFTYLLDILKSFCKR